MSDDAPPPAKSARVRPAARQVHSQRVRRVTLDPRFDPMFGRADPKVFEANYKFLRDQQHEEETQRRFRMRCLKCLIRRHELEEAGEDLDEYDLTDEERETFGPDHQQELAALKLTPPERIYAELEQLQRACQLHVSRTKNAVADSRHEHVKKEIMRKELQSVKDGTKSKPFYPKRSVVKRAVLADTFDKLEAKGGKAAVDRYVARKVKH